MTQLKTGTNGTVQALESPPKFDSSKFFVSETAELGLPEKIAQMNVVYMSPAKSSSKLFIRNMVSTRCKIVVKAELENFGLHCLRVELGEAEISEQLSSEQHEQLRNILLKTGLELVWDKKEILIEKIKTYLIEMIHYSDELPKIKISCYLSEKLNHNYTYLSNIFSEKVGRSIQQFIIMHKIERVKELLIYEDLTLSQIALKLHYSSVAHLSSQFKKATGRSSSFFKKLKHKELIALENV